VAACPVLPTYGAEQKQRLTSAQNSRGGSRIWVDSSCFAVTASVIYSSAHG
jgi:hypothetical protein